MGEVLKNIRQKPVIAALRGEALLEAALSSGVSTLFYLRADILSLPVLAEKARERGKNALFHLEFIDGLGRDAHALQYLAKVAQPDGVITTRASTVRDARDVGLFTIQRIFMVDTQSYDTAVKSIEAARPDMVEMMPGIMPQVIRRMAGDIRIPIIAGGLITTREEAFSALQAGAAAVSTGAQDLWNMLK